MSIFICPLWQRLRFPKGLPVNSSNLCVCSQTALGQHQPPTAGGETKAQTMEGCPSQPRPHISDQTKASAPPHLPAFIPALRPCWKPLIPSIAWACPGPARKVVMPLAEAVCPSLTSKPAQPLKGSPPPCAGQLWPQILCRIHYSQNDEEK